MANYSTLKTAVADVVKTNGSQAITGANLQSVLLSIINSVGGGYIFKGVATPSTSAGTPDQNVFYIAGAGTYANFGTSVVVPPTNIAVFKYNGTWTCEQVMVENGGVFDISAFKAVGSTLATYADLASALGTNGANVPEGVRKGGMSIKFVQSPDNKYVQYRLTSNVFTTAVTDWQELNEEKIYNEIGQRQYANSNITDFALRNGYIHSNASAGFFPSDKHRCTYPIFVYKGTIIVVKYKNLAGGMTVISKTDRIGSQYTSIFSSSYGTVEYGYLVVRYVAREDMYVCACGFAEWLHIEFNTSVDYTTKKSIENQITFSCSGSWQHPYKFIKGHRYLVKNTGNSNTSCYTRYENDGDYTANGGLIDKIVSEQTVDQDIPNLLSAGTWSIFIATDNANYIVGYTSVTNVYIEDLSLVNNRANEFGRAITSNVCNTIYQSREGRVSSVYYPNQTKWGISEALKNQYDRIRFTVRKTVDETPVYFLCHNNTINALAMNMDGTPISGDVSSEGKTLNELNSYDWGIKYGEKYAGMQVPLLEDALYYASLYNLGVTLEFNSTMTETDCRAIFKLCSKYGVVDNLILISNFIVYNYFKQYSNKISYFWGGTYQDFLSALNSIKSYKSELNNIYICCYPFGSYPSDDYLTAIYENDFIPYHSSSFNVAEFKATLGKGIGLIECANVPFIKEEANKYADERVEQ